MGCGAGAARCGRGQRAAGWGARERVCGRGAREGRRKARDKLAGPGPLSVGDDSVSPVWFFRAWAGNTSPVGAYSVSERDVTMTPTTARIPSLFENPDLSPFSNEHTDEDKINEGRAVPCRICERAFRRLRLTARYCATCHMGFCEGEHFNFSHGNRGTCVLCGARNWPERQH